MSVDFEVVHVSGDSGSFQLCVVLVVRQSY